MSTALALYGDAIGGEPLHVRFADGRRHPVPVDTWLGATAAADETVLARAVAPVIDVGCGPGRHVLACARHGLLAVGVDVSAHAVAEARRRGAHAIQRDVFGTLPGAGTWGSALLLDGNVGIGGAPVKLLTRVRGLLRADGRILVELEPPGGRSGATRVRLERGTVRSDWFPWAHQAADEVAATAAAAGLRIGATWDAQGRWFASLASAAAR